MKSKILKLKLVKYAKSSPEVNVWNIFDSEHPHYVHAKENMAMVWICRKH
jgi:hypothetical protein